MAKILLVEDDAILAEFVAQALGFQHHTVDTIGDGTAALEYASTNNYDVIILDRKLPGLSGTEICQTFRGRGGITPILMLTNMTSLKEKVTGFECGADDYLAKPFDLQELSARVQALLRRPTAYVSEKLTIRDVSIDTASHIVYARDVEVHLKPLEYQVLEFFMRHPNRVISIDELVTRVWPTEAEPSTGAVYSCITKIRKKLGLGTEDYIQTVHGVGYRLKN